MTPPRVLRGRSPIRTQGRRQSVRAAFAWQARTPPPAVPVGGVGAFPGKPQARSREVRQARQSSKPTGPARSGTTEPEQSAGFVRQLQLDVRAGQE